MIYTKPGVESYSDRCTFEIMLHYLVEWATWQNLRVSAGIEALILTIKMTINRVFLPLLSCYCAFELQKENRDDFGSPEVLLQVGFLCFFSCFLHYSSLRVLLLRSLRVFIGVLLLSLLLLVSCLLPSSSSWVKKFFMSFPLISFPSWSFHPYNLKNVVWWGNLRFIFDWGEFQESSSRMF